MNLPYHLNEYKSKIDTLSAQSKSLLEFCISNSEVEKFIERINQENKLEKESIKILKKAILDGYDCSIYTYSWKFKEELELWELIHSKCDEENKVYFILASLQCVNNIKAYEVKDLFFKAFDQHLDYIFSLDDSIIEQFYSNFETRYVFLVYEFRARVTQWEDFEENWNDGAYWINIFGNDEKAMAIINHMLNEKRN